MQLKGLLAGGNIYSDLETSRAPICIVCPKAFVRE
jgi:hypothetical protein